MEELPCSSSALWEGDGTSQDGATALCWARDSPRPRRNRPSRSGRRRDFGFPLWDIFPGVEGGFEAAEEGLVGQGESYSPGRSSCLIVPECDRMGPGTAECTQDPEGE